MNKLALIPLLFAASVTVFLAAPARASSNCEDQTNNNFEECIDQAIDQGMTLDQAATALSGPESGVVDYNPPADAMSNQSVIQSYTNQVATGPFAGSGGTAELVFGFCVAGEDSFAMYFKRRSQPAYRSAERVCGAMGGSWGSIWISPW